MSKEDTSPVTGFLHCTVLNAGLVTLLGMLSCPFSVIGAVARAGAKFDDCGKFRLSSSFGRETVVTSTLLFALEELDGKFGFSAGFKPDAAPDLLRPHRSKGDRLFERNLLSELKSRWVVARSPITSLLRGADRLRGVRLESELVRSAIVGAAIDSHSAEGCL